jgi:FkbM family methyltransferase
MIEVIQQKLDSIQESIEITDSRAGNFLIYKNDNTISLAIKLLGEYCQAEVDIISGYLNQNINHLYLDVGTNIAYHAVAVHKQTNCNVIGFEPNPKHFALATYNSKDYDRIQLVNAAASDVNRLIKMKDFNETVNGNYGNVHKSNMSEIEVQAITIDELLLSHCSLMKIGVKGHEHESLCGATNLISRCRPVIIYEAMDWDVWTKCYDFLDTRRYKQYWISCKLNPLSKTYKHSEEDPFAITTISNILAVPIEKEQPDYLVPVLQNEGFTTCLDRYKKLKILF